MGSEKSVSGLFARVCLFVWASGCRFWNFGEKRVGCRVCLLVCLGEWVPILLFLGKGLGVVCACLGEWVRLVRIMFVYVCCLGERVRLVCILVVCSCLFRRVGVSGANCVCLFLLFGRVGVFSANVECLFVLSECVLCDFFFLGGGDWVCLVPTVFVCVCLGE